MSAPERFEDLPPDLQQRVREAGDLTDPAWSRRRGSRAFVAASVAFALLAVPGGWLVSAPTAGMCLVNAALVLHRTWGSPRHDAGRRWAWSAVAVGAVVLGLIVFQVWRIRAAGDVLDSLFAG